MPLGQPKWVMVSECVCKIIALFSFYVQVSKTITAYRYLVIECTCALPKINNHRNQMLINISQQSSQHLYNSTRCVTPC